MKYNIIISHGDVVELINTVNSMIKDGWICQGGVAVTIETIPYYQKIYYQAMVKE